MSAFTSALGSLAQSAGEGWLRSQQMEMARRQLEGQLANLSSEAQARIAQSQYQQGSLDVQRQQLALERQKLLSGWGQWEKTGNKTAPDGSTTAIWTNRVTGETRQSPLSAPGELVEGTPAFEGAAASARYKAQYAAQQQAWGELAEASGLTKGSKPYLAFVRKMSVRSLDPGAYQYALQDRSIQRQLMQQLFTESRAELNQLRQARTRAMLDPVAQAMLTQQGGSLAALDKQIGDKQAEMMGYLRAFAPPEMLPALQRAYSYAPAAQPPALAPSHQPTAAPIVPGTKPKVTIGPNGAITVE